MKFDWQSLIKDLRQYLLLTQEEMANKLGIAFCTLNRYENGHYEPTMKIKRKVKQLAIDNKIKINEYQIK